MCGALSDERTGLSFICYWPLPAQSFSGPSPLLLATIFYCLRIETSLFVASYNSQGHGGGIRPRLHREISSVCNCRYIVSAPTTHKTANVVEECLPRRCIATVAARIA
jgi:hypothetical protein